MEKSVAGIVSIQELLYCFPLIIRMLFAVRIIRFALNLLQRANFSIWIGLSSFCWTPGSLNKSLLLVYVHNILNASTDAALQWTPHEVLLYVVELFGLSIAVIIYFACEHVLFSIWHVLFILKLEVSYIKWLEKLNTGRCTRKSENASKSLCCIYL